MDAQFSVLSTLMGLVGTAMTSYTLFVGEVGSVRTRRSLAQARGRVVPASSDSLEPGIEGALIHVTGRAVTEREMLSDTIFGVLAPAALRLERRVEMYQWREKTDTRTIGAGKPGSRKQTYTTYDKIWYQSRLDHRNFKRPEGHENPPMPVPSTLFDAEPIRLGRLELCQELVAQLESWQSIPLESFPPPGGFHREKDYFCTGRLDEPELGDLRVSFRRVDSGVPISVMARRSAQTRLEPWHAEAGDDICRLVPGQQSPEVMLSAMIGAEVEDSHTTRWITLIMMVGMVGFTLCSHFQRLWRLPVSKQLILRLGDNLGMAATFLIVGLALWLTIVALAQVAGRLGLTRL